MKYMNLALGRKSLRLFAAIAILVSVIFVVHWIKQADTSGNRRQRDKTKLKDELDEELTFKQNLRRNQMQEYCRKRGMNASNEDNLDFSNVIVSEKYKLVFCPVPKVSCTVWKTLLAELEGVNIEKNVHQEVKYKLKSLQRYSLEERRHILNTYTKFMFVRDPFERLLSAYKDVFLGWYKQKDNFWQGYRRKVREYLLQNGRADIDPNLDNTTFEEFATYVVLTKRSGKELQVHWRSMNDLCHPCYIQFDYIGHYETLLDDAEFILKKANLQDKVEFPQWRPTSTHHSMQKYYLELPLLRIVQLQIIYKDDFEAFGYTFPGLLQPVIDMLINIKI